MASYVSIKQEMEGLVSKRDQIINLAASKVAHAVLSAQKEGKLTINYTNNISNLLGGFSEDERSEILLLALVMTGTNTTPNRIPPVSGKYDDYDDMAGTIFSGRKRR